MRKPIGLLVAYLFPPRGVHRSTNVPRPPQPKRVPWPTTQPHDGPALRGEDVALIRPYLLAFERQREARRQRDRRTAAALATMGIDYKAVSA